MVFQASIPNVVNLPPTHHQKTSQHFYLLHRASQIFVVYDKQLFRHQLKSAVAELFGWNAKNLSTIFRKCRREFCTEPVKGELLTKKMRVRQGDAQCSSLMLQRFCHTSWQSNNASHINLVNPRHYLMLLSLRQNFEISTWKWQQKHRLKQSRHVAVS